MGFEFEHLYCSVIGDSYTSAEKWQFGFRLLNIAVPGSTNQAAADALAVPIQAWWAGTGYAAGSQFLGANSHRLTEIKVASIAQNGDYIPNSIAASHFVAPPVTGPGSSLAIAPQLACAVTLLTARPRGLASKGRVFLPVSQHYQVGIGNGVMTDSAVTNIANSMIKLINAINVLPETGPVMVMSKGKAVPEPAVLGKPPKYTYPNPGVSFAVTGVKVGHVIDTQRRRRRQLPEGYVSLPL